MIATGPFQIPRVPGIAERLDPDITQFHSSRYRGPHDVPAGPVLVVGGGNTGYQIAEELARTHSVHLSIGARQAPLPQRILGRDLFRYLEAFGLMGKTVESRIGQRLQRGETLVGSSPRAARRRHGIELRGRTDDVSGSVVRFSDGGRLSPGAVIWATGFELDHSFVHLPVFDTDGRLVHRRGVTASPGLYFLGMPWQHTRGSALLGWVKHDAQYIADQIALAITGTRAPAPALAAEPPRAMSALTPTPGRDTLAS